MDYGFDTSMLDDYVKDMISFASKTFPKQSNKFIKKSATDLSKVQKNTLKSFGIGDTGITEKEVLISIKSGKTYKYNGDLSCRAYCSHPLGHLLDAGYIHKGGFKDKTGAETWVSGYHFIEKAEEQYRAGYYRSVQDFLDDMIKNM